MPLPVIADVFRVTFNYTSSTNGGTAHNVMHFRAPTLTAETLADAIQDNITSGLYDVTGGSFRVTSIDVTPLDGSSATHTRSLETAAASNADFGRQMCAVVSLQTAERGRSARGRLYIPFVQEGAQTGGLLGTTNAGNLAGAWGTFLNAMAADAAQLVVASYLNASALDVENIIVRLQVCTQRRRALRVP